MACRVMLLGTCLQHTSSWGLFSRGRTLRGVLSGRFVGILRCASVRNYCTAFSFMQTDCYPLGSRICMDDINLDNLLLSNPDFCISFRELVDEWHSTVPFRASKSTSSLTSLPLSMASSANPYRNSFFGTYQMSFLCRASPCLCVG